MLNKTVLPKDWDTTTIGVSCDILDHMRIPVNSSDRFERKGDITYYGANGLQGWIDDYIFDEELVLLAEDGGYFDEFENRPIAYMVRGKSWVNNHAHVLRARKQIATNHWIFYNLVHKDIQYYIQGGTRSKLNQSELRNIEVPLPPLPEQRRIAEILDTIDEAIQKTEALISKLKAMKQGLLHDLLTRGLDKNGKLRNPKAHQEQFKNSPLGRIPKEWDVGRIDQFLNPTDGIKPGPFGSSITKIMYTPEGYKVYGQEQVIAGDLTVGDYYISTDKFNELRTFEIHENDILMSLVGTVGRVLVVQSPFRPGIINPRLIRFRPVLSKGNPIFLRELLMSDIVKRQLASLFQGGTMPVLSATIVRKLILAKPKQYEQEMIAKVLVAHDARIRTEEQYRDKLKLQKKGLMHDLLTGKVRVKGIRNTKLT